MAAWGYEFYLLVLNLYISHSFASLTRERYFQHSKKKICIPARPCNILYFKALIEILMGPVGPYEPKRQLKRTTKSSKQN